jgi:hypothetical protein
MDRAIALASFLAAGAWAGVYWVTPANSRLKILASVVLAFAAVCAVFAFVVSEQ